MRRSGRFTYLEASESFTMDWIIESVFLEIEDTGYMSLSALQLYKSIALPLPELRKTAY